MKRTRAHVLAAILAAGLAVIVQAQAQPQTQSITLTGTIGSRAILIVGGGAPRTLAPGESLQGVRLVSVQDGEAIVESGGKRLTLRMGAPVSVGGSGGGGGGGSRIVLTADSRGHFVTAGGINGRPVTFMLDTGATAVALSMADAQRIGLDPTRGQPVTMNTANGTAPGWRIFLPCSGLVMARAWSRVPRCLLAVWPARPIARWCWSAMARCAPIWPPTARRWAR